MATLNITTNKTRAQMITELTNWDDATKVSGYDYVWACVSNINVVPPDSNVEVTADISGLNLIFASTKRMFASPGGTIIVSNDFIDRYNYPTKITVKNASDTDIGLVRGTGKWVGKGLTFAVESGNLRFDSNTSQTQLRDLSVDALIPSVSALRVLLHDAGEISLYRVTGMTVIRYGGILSMNPRGIGLVSSQSYGPAKLVAINATFPGFVISSDATHRTQTASSAYDATTMTFVDGKVNPEFLDAYPKDNDAVIRLIKRTITFKPVSNDGSNVSGFKYRISSNRVLQPAGTTTTNFTIVKDQDGNFNGTYLLTVWKGTRPTGTDTYNPLRDRTIDKDMRVQYRKYGLKEASFSSNSYDFAVDAPTIMATDTFVSTNPVIFNTYVNASQFYDSIRSGCATYFDIPEDVLITDGKTLTIKTGWKLKRSATTTATVVHPTPKEIILDKDSYLGKMDTGIFKFDTIAGFVDDSVNGHTNMAYARNDGKATLNVEITCPTGATDPIAGIWPFSQGVDDRTNMITGTATGDGVKTISLVADPAVKYYCVAKGNGANQYAPFAVDPIGALGTTVKITLFVYKKADGTPILPVTLTTEQTAIADMFIFDSGHIDIKIPTGFASNARWSAADKMWQFTASDFIAIAWKLDHLQTVVLFLQNNQLLYILDGSLLVSATANSAILEQDSTNQATVGGTEPPKISLTTISMGRIGDTNARNTFIDNKNGTIDIRGGTPVSVSVSVSGGFTTTAAAELTAVKTETDKITSVKTETDKITAVKTETDKIPAIKTETDKITAVKTETDKITSVKTETDKIAAVKTETDKITAVKTNTDTLPAIKTETDKIAAVKTETDKIPAVKTETDKITAVKTETDKITAVKTETDKIPAIQTKADETHQRLALDSTKPLTSKPDGGITSTGIAITATELPDGSVVQTRGT